MKSKTKVLIITVSISLILGVSLVPMNILTKTVADNSYELSIPDNSSLHLPLHLRGGYSINITITFLSVNSTRVTFWGSTGDSHWIHQITSNSSAGITNIYEVHKEYISTVGGTLYEGGDVKVNITVKKKPITLTKILGSVSGLILFLGLLIFFSINYWSKISPTLTKPTKKIKKRVEELRKRKQLKREEEEAKRLQEQKTKEGLASGKLLCCPSCSTIIEVDDENCSGCNLRIDQFEIYRKKRN